MALDTYTNLRAEIADFVNRDDLSSVIPTFILLTEVELNRRLRDRRMLRRAIATLSLQYLRLPSGLVSLRDIQLNSDPPVPLAGSTPQALNDLRAGSNQSGKPRHYAHLGEQLEVYPTPDAAQSRRCPIRPIRIGFLTITQIYTCGGLSSRQQNI